MNPDFHDILSAFCDENVEFLVVGAYALAGHGLPRATGNIDIWILRSEENAERTMRALRRFGAPLFDLTLNDLIKPNIVFQIGVPPNRIDILTSIDGVEFDSAREELREIRIDDLTIPIIGRRHLILNKRAPAGQKICSI